MTLLLGPPQRRRSWPGLLTVLVSVWTIGLLAVPGSSRGQSTQGSPPDSDSGTLPAAIPLFPLPDIAVFPGVRQPLHIFEPRYRAMVVDALAGDRVIGMVMLRPGYEAEYEGNPAIYSIGCAGTIESVEELPDGRYNIVIRGSTKFRIESEDTSGPYRLAQVAAISETLSEEDLEQLSGQRERIVDLLRTVAPRTQVPPSLSDEDVVNTLSQYAPLDATDRQALLEATGALARSEALVDLLQTMRRTPRRRRGAGVGAPL